METLTAKQIERLKAVNIIADNENLATKKLIGYLESQNIKNVSDETIDSLLEMVEAMHGMLGVGRDYTKVRMIIMSHLSDAQGWIGASNEISGTAMNNHINFAKYLLLEFPNTDEEIDADEYWINFTTNLKN